jgi:signal transduction histidine kinase
MQAPGRVQYMTPRWRWLGLGALTVLAPIGLWARPADHGTALAIAGAIFWVAAAVLLSRASARFVLPCAVLVTAGVAMVGTEVSSDLGWIAVCVLAAWCVLGAPGRVYLIFWAGSLLLIGAEWLRQPHDPGWGAWAAGISLTVLLTAIVRHELDLVDQLQAAQAGLAERSRAEERNRIAREVHNVIAHSLTVSLLHLQSAWLAVEYEPAEAVRALAEAERLCQQSLTEVRSTVGLLREDPGAGDRPEPPAPGIDDLAELAGRVRLAGADVTLRTEGDTGRLPATTGSAIYRILQEALTNTAKHAPGAPVEVWLYVARREVVLQVDSAGPPSHGTGMGLLSMHERAEALGGRCAAGPGGHGWLVRAELPLDASLRPGVR